MGGRLLDTSPWGHNLVLLTRFKDNGLRLRYAAAAVGHYCNRHRSRRPAPPGRPPGAWEDGQTRARPGRLADGARGS